MSKNTKLTIFIVLLILIATGAGYLMKKGANVTPALQQGVTSPGDSVAEILAFRGEGATKKARAQFRELVHSLAKEGTTITINAGCSPDPFILKVKVDEPITVENKDSIEHRLSLRGESTEIVILPDDSATFLMSDFVERDFDPRGGVVRYRCDTVRSGVFYITS